MTKQKVVIKVLAMNDDRSRAKAMKIAAGVQGVISIELQSAEKNQIAVVGEGIDSTHLTMLIRKKIGFTELVSVTPISEKKVEKKEEKKETKTNPATVHPMVWTSHQQYGTPYMYQQHDTPHVYVSEDNYHHNQDNCSVM